MPRKSLCFQSIMQVQKKLMLQRRKKLEMLQRSTYLQVTR